MKREDNEEKLGKKEKREGHTSVLVEHKQTNKELQRCRRTSWMDNGNRYKIIKKQLTEILRKTIHFKFQFKGPGEVRVSDIRGYSRGRWHNRKRMTSF